MHWWRLFLDRCLLGYTTWFLFRHYMYIRDASAMLNVITVSHSWYRSCLPTFSNKFVVECPTTRGYHLKRDWFLWFPCMLRTVLRFEIINVICEINSLPYRNLISHNLFENFYNCFESFSFTGSNKNLSIFILFSQIITKFLRAKISNIVFNLMRFPKKWYFIFIIYFDANTPAE